MDLRYKDLSAKDIEQIHQFITRGKLAYQPFIFTDTLEVGEGLKFYEGENSSGGGNVYWEGVDPKTWVDPDPRAENSLVTDLERFRTCNQELREIYEHFLDTLVEQLGGNISDLTFAEIGCNTGYFLHGLALRGAKKCIGYDFTDNSDVFAWFNQVLGINSEFYFAEWDSLSHSLKYAELAEVDVILSIAVTCHLADPIHHLAYLCDHAKQAVFVWSPITANNNDRLAITFDPPGKYPNALDWPLSFDNDVRLSIPLLRMCLEQAGFDKIFEVMCPEGMSPNWKRWCSSQRGYIAFRTSPTKTALSDGKKSRTVTPSLLEENYNNFNIVGYLGRYYALSKTLGPVYLGQLDEQEMIDYQAQDLLIIGQSLEEVKQRVDQVTIQDTTPRLIEEDYADFNIVAYGGQYYALSKALGPVYLGQLDKQSLKQHEKDGLIRVDDSLIGVKKLVDQLQ